MISLILARGGSKGIPRKNIKLLNNKPLIGHVIDSALQTKNIKKVFVSTDDEEIASVSKEFGAEIIKRPEIISRDDSKDIEAFIHALSFLEKELDEIVHLRATTPILDPKILDLGIEYYLENKNLCTSMRSGHETPESVYKFFKIEDKYFKGLFEDLNDEYYNSNRQNIVKTFKPNGYIDIVKPKVFREGKTFHGDKILAFLTPLTYEVDTLEEFEYIEYILAKNE